MPTTTNINVKDFVIIRSVDSIQRGYVRDTLQSIPPINFEISNESLLMEMVVVFSSAPGVAFTPASLGLMPNETKSFVVRLDPMQLNSLPEGLNAIDILANVSISNLTVVLQAINTVVSSIPPTDPNAPIEIGDVTHTPPGLPVVWRNGITRQTIPGTPPTDWELRVDGFWYPVTPASGGGGGGILGHILREDGGAGGPVMML
jgi:hypothetical protein